MAKYIATWICIDGQDNASYFPSSKGFSSDVNIQKIYWKCVLTFFSTAKRYVTNEKLILFTNTKEIPVTGEINIEETLRNMDVSIQYLEFDYKVPERIF
jgi:hypothetical protein